MRDIDIKKLRPPIPTIIEANSTTLTEIFQNRTIRPILKLQNDLLLQIFQHYIKKRKGTFYTLNEPKKLTYIEECIRKDLRFKSRLVGIIIGHFTLEEWTVFQEQESELTRRITDLLVQRLQNQVDLLVHQ